MSNARNLASFGSIVGGLTGEIKMWSLPTPPAGYLICDGTSYSTSTYANLFAVLGYTFGGANNSFLVPNYQDRSPIGVNTIANTVGATGGSSTNTITANNLPAHTHSITDPGHHHLTAATGSTIFGSGPSYSGVGAFSGAVSGNSDWASSSYTGITATNNTQGSGSSFSNTALNNMSPYLGIYFIIRYL